MLGIDDHLVMSLMGNMITDYRGAAKYVDDHFETNQAAVCLHFRRKFRRDKVDPSAMVQYDFLCNDRVLRQGAATHVVVAVTYSIQFLCVARHQIGDTEQREDAEERLSCWMNHWKQSLLADKYSLQGQLEGARYCMYTDIQPPSGLVSDQVCYQLCMDAMRSDNRNSVPFKVWLCPLDKLTSKAAKNQLGREISPRVVEQSHLLVSELDKVIQLSGQLAARGKQLDPSTNLCAKMGAFHQCITKFRDLVFNQIRRSTCSVRRGATYESVIEELVATVRESAFDPLTLTKWLVLKKKEMDILQYVTSLPDIRLIFDPKIVEQTSDQRLILVLRLHCTSPDLNELKAMQQYVQINTKIVRWTGSRSPAFPDDIDMQKLRMQVIRFAKFVAANVTDSGVDYFVLHDGQSGTSPESRLQLFRAGALVAGQVNYPETPGNVHVLENRRAKLTLQWDCQQDQWLNHYVVEYRDHQSFQWNEIVARDQRFQFTNLRHRTSYQFRVACRSSFGRGSFSPEVGPFTVQSICDAPQCIRQMDITDTSLTITWEDPPLQDGIPISGYVVNCWPQQQKSDLRRVTCHQKFCTLDGLEADKLYVIQLMVECGSLGSGSASEPLEIRTNAEPDRLANILREVSQLSTEDPTVKVYQIPLEEKTGTKGIRRFHLGRGINKYRRKTILVVGPTGSGKTTFINALLNHMVGVRWEDDFRLKLIQEPAKTQAFSQTQNVTVYDIFRMKGSNLGYSLTIVDTPGFGDTRGLERDKMIMEQIRQYFQSPDGVLGLEAVCFLLQASLARLTPTQKYIYDSILSLFGKDIKDNIRLMITFADNREPRVLSSIRASDIPYALDDRGRIKCHKFNNSSLFVPVYTQDAQEDFFNKVLYDMTAQSFQQFLTDLAAMQTTSLMLTKEVLLERRRLEVVVEGLQLRIQHGLDRLEEFNQIRNALSEQEQRMDFNENSQFQVTFSVPEAVDISGTGHYVTNCQKCKRTCHYPCSQANDLERFKCSVMDAAGMCKVCPGQCPWDQHFNQKFRYEWVKRTETRSMDAVRQQYQVAANEKLSKQQLSQRLAKELESYEKNVMDLVNMTYPSIKRLDEIALKPHPFSAPEYIDMIIEAELLEGETGYKQRIESLKKLKQMAEIQSKMIKGQSLFDSKSFVSSETNAAMSLSHSSA